MKAKIEKIIKEMVRNEAISTEKLMELAKKEGLNQKRITYVFRKAGVVEILGKGVYRVLIRDKNIDDYILKSTKLMEADIEKRSGTKKKKKAEKLDMSLPGKWTSTEEQLPHEILDMPDTDAAEEDIDMHAKMLDMMKQVQTNTNKQNEYTSSLAAKIDEIQRKVLYQGIAELEKKVARMETLLNNELENAFEKIIDAEDELRIAKDRDVELGKRIENHKSHMLLHHDRLEKLEERIDADSDHELTRINALEKRYEKLNNMPSVLQKIDEHLDFHKQLEKRIESLENRMNMCGEEIVGLDDKIDSQVEIIEDKLKERNSPLAPNNNLALIKAARGLLAEIE